MFGQDADANPVSNEIVSPDVAIRKQNVRFKGVDNFCRQKCARSQPDLSWVGSTQKWMFGQRTHIRLIVTKCAKVCLLGNELSLARIDFLRCDLKRSFDLCHATFTMSLHNRDFHVTKWYTSNAKWIGKNVMLRIRNEFTSDSLLDKIEPTAETPLSKNSKHCLL